MTRPWRLGDTFPCRFGARGITHIVRVVKTSSPLLVAVIDPAYIWERGGRFFLVDLVVNTESDIVARDWMQADVEGNALHEWKVGDRFLVSLDDKLVYEVLVLTSNEGDVQMTHQVLVDRVVGTYHRSTAFVPNTGTLTEQARATAQQYLGRVYRAYQTNTWTTDVFHWVDVTMLRL